MPDHKNGRLKSGGSGFKKGERLEETAGTPQLSRKKVKGSRTGNNSIPRFSDTYTHDVLTDYDTVEIFHRVLLKKYDGNHQQSSYHLVDWSRHL